MTILSFKFTVFTWKNTGTINNHLNLFYLDIGVNFLFAITSPLSESHTVNDSINAHRQINALYI